MMRREKNKLERTLGGIRNMTRTPSAVWVVDTNKEALAVAEARKLRIPVVAILDTNCDPDLVDYPVPGNDDAIRSIGLLTRVIADAVAAGLMERAAGKSGDAPAEAEPLADWEVEQLQAKDEANAEADVAADAPLEAPVAEEAPAEEVVEVEAAEAPVAEVATEEVAVEAAAEEAPATDQ